MSLARFPESVQLINLAVDGIQQVFWLIAPDIQPSQFIENQWLSRFWISDCESQQRDCAGISPASLHWMQCKGTTKNAHTQVKWENICKKDRFYLCHTIYSTRSSWVWKWEHGGYVNNNSNNIIQQLPPKSTSLGGKWRWRCLKQKYAIIDGYKNLKKYKGYYFAYRYALLMLVLIRLIKASFIILLNPILNHLHEQISSKIDLKWL